MANELRRAGKYWILYYQPTPESGERIAIALAFEDPNRGARLEFDTTFGKVLKLFPDANLDTLLYYLEDLRAQISRSVESEAILNSYGPQIALSSPRRIAIPVSEAAVKMLMVRYIYPAKKGKTGVQRVDKVATEIEAYVRSRATSGLVVERNVSSRDILGRNIVGIKKVALAIRSSTGWTLVDGIDLNHLSPKAATDRADDVSRTFWNYRRASTGPGEEIKTVGVVLNGHSHEAPNTLEAHDYALHRFQVESSVAIDAASVEGERRLRSVLENIDQQQ